MEASMWIPCSYFIIVASPGSGECASALTTLEQVCAYLGHKKEGPATSLTFLDIEMDTMMSQLRVPQDKLQRLQGLLQD